MRSPDLEIQELDLSKEVAQKWIGFTPFVSSPSFLCYGVDFDFPQQRPQNLRSFGNLLPKLDFTIF